MKQKNRARLSITAPVIQHIIRTVLLTSDWWRLLARDNPPGTAVLYWCVRKIMNQRLMRVPSASIEIQTGPKASLQAFAFTAYFCLSNSISWLFHHTSALILCKQSQQCSVMQHLTIQIVLKATILLQKRLYFFFTMILHNCVTTWVICEDTVCVDGEQAAWPVGDNAVSLITGKM